jgi:outer membrane protein assembly factor BamA
MKFVWLGGLIFASLLAAGTTDSEANINTRYTVEDVLVSTGTWTARVASENQQKLSSNLRKDILSLIGEKFNPSALDDLAHRLRRELHARTVEHRLRRGKSPDYVQVVFEVSLNPTSFDVSVPKFLYQGQQGWSGAVEGTATIRQQGFMLGLVSDGDVLVERYTGVEGHYEDAHLGTDRLHFGLEVDSYHEKWNDATLAIAQPDQIYRTRQNVQPMLTFLPSRQLSFSVGASFEQMEMVDPAAHTMAANSLAAGARYQHGFEGSEFLQEVEGDYSLRAGMRSLGSDFAYSRHRWRVRYSLTHGKHSVADDLTGGLLTGNAPLFERFVLGNSWSLRGWNKNDIDPIGGNRMLNNSVEYRYGALEVFYDTGAVWNSGTAATTRNSVGTGIREGLFTLAVAFPLKDGRTDPVFMLGMNY